MQDLNGRRTQDRRTKNQQSTGRVVDIRAWRTRKKIQNMRGQRRRLPLALRIMSFLVLALSVMFTVGTCIPFAQQLQCALFAGFFATVGCALSIWLYVVRDKYATKLLAIQAVCLLITMVAASFAVGVINL